MRLKYLFSIALPIMLASVASAQIFNLYPASGSVNTPTKSVTLLNIETPFRCQTDDIRNQKIITSVKVEKDDFKLRLANTLDELPRYEVNGYSFEEMPLDEALQQLVEEAKIEVFTDDETYVTLNAKDIYGELSVVIDELTRAGETYYKYDAKQKGLYLSRRANFELKLPNNRVLMLGVLDALRGAGIENITPNWDTGILSLLLTREEEERIQELVTQIMKDGQLLVADTQVYALTSFNTNGNWDKIIQSFGADKIHSSNNGLMGKLLSMDHQTSSKKLMQYIRQYYQVTPISQGMAVVPNGWKMRFDINRCANAAYAQSQISVLLYPHLKKNGRIDTQVTIDSTSGELSTFKVNTAIDDELAVIGIPDQNNVGVELLTIMNLKLLRLVGGK